MKISVSYALKRGLPNYGSESASVSIEKDVKPGESIEVLQDMARSYVECELSGRPKHKAEQGGDKLYEAIKEYKHNNGKQAMKLMVYSVFGADLTWNDIKHNPSMRKLLADRMGVTE